MYFWFISELYVHVDLFVKLISWELISRTVDFVRVDLMGVDLVGVELRRQLTTTPVLAYPDFTREFIVDTDASDTGIGAVLSQVDDEGRERPITYASRLLSKAERKYCVTRRELLAV